MAEAEDIIDEQDEFLEDNSHQACYVFKPISGQDYLADPRPTKKRKTNKSNVVVPTEFPLLLDGNEPESHAKRRGYLFDQTWSEKEARADQIANHLNQEALQEFTTFISDVETRPRSERLPVALLTSRSQSNVQDQFLKGWNQETTTTSGRIMVHLRPSQCSNLQTALKNTIKMSIMQTENLDYYNDFLNKHKKLIPINSDLELLQLYTKEKNITSIIVSILDVETFEMTVINDMIAILHSWSDRLSFVLVIGLATTADLFESRLPKSRLRLLDARMFELSIDFDQSYRIFRTCQTDSSSNLFIGPSVSNALFEMTESQVSTPQAFTQAVKYIYMSHFFSNALSILLDSEYSFKPQESKALCEAIRNADSFRTYCEELLERDPAQRIKIKELLENDKALLEEAKNAVHHGRQAFFSSARVVSAVTELHQAIASTPSNTRQNDSAFEVEIQLYKSLSSLTDSSIYQSTGSSLRKLQPTGLLEILAKCNPENLQILNIDVTANLQNLQSYSRHDSSAPAETALSLTPTRARPAKATKAKSNSTTAKATTGQEKAYTELLNKLLTQLESTVHEHSFPPPNAAGSSSSIPLCNEAYLFNLRQPLHAALIAPRPRYAIERALSKPADYLGCEHASCGGSSGRDDTGTQPPTSLLYTLLAEAGTLINVRDLFEAFKARLQNRTSIADELEQGESSDALVKTLFYRALSDMKYLGLVKAASNATTTQAKKKATKTAGSAGAASNASGAGEIELIAKTSWFGL